jgi:hypothetical protein
MKYILLFLTLIVACVAAPLSMDAQLGAMRVVEANKCIPESGMRFLNATLFTLALPNPTQLPLLSNDEYVTKMGRYIAHVTESMGSGLFTFCDAIARANRLFAVEWTRGEYIAQPEVSYRNHCQQVLGATDERAYYLSKNPTLTHDLYQCLRIGMFVPLILSDSEGES